MINPLHSKAPSRNVWAAALAALVLVACGSSSPSEADTDSTDSTDAVASGGETEATTAETPQETETIRLVPWGGRFIDFIDFYVAEENGYFADAGIEFEQLPGAGAGDAVRQVVAGNADIAMADPISGFFSQIAGEELDGIYCPYTKNWLTMLVNTADGIESPADLAGKTIAVTSQASTSKWYASLLLADNGISEDDVVFAATGVDFGSALLSGEAQAASTWGSVNWGLLDNGGIPADQAADYEIWAYDQVPGPNDVYFAKAGWAEENQDLLGRFIGAIEQAKTWIEENPDAAAELGATAAEGAENIERNRAVIDYRIDMQNEGPGVADHGRGWCDVDTIQQIADQSYELGIIESEVDAAAMFSNRYVGS